MKIDPKNLIDPNLIITEILVKKDPKVFEDYLKEAIKEIESLESLKQTEGEKIKYLTERLEFSLDLLDKVAKTPLNFATSQTLADFFLTQAFEMEKIAETLPDGALKNLFLESAIYLGVEGEKIKQGFYQA